MSSSGYVVVLMSRFMTFSNWVSGLKCNIIKANAAVYKELMLELASGYVTCPLVFLLRL